MLAIPVKSDLICVVYLHCPTVLDTVNVSDLEEINDQDTDDNGGCGM